MYSPVLAKTRYYSDKSVQTDSDVVLSIPAVGETPISPALVISDGLVDSFGAAPGLASGFEGAYTQPQTSEMSGTLSSRSIAKPSLDYSRPSEAHTIGQTRVISLPTVVVADDVKVSLGKKFRVVSLPERGVHASLSVAVEASQNSMQDVQGRKARRGRLYPSDVPHTPSPPSSPDSILIIGNETHDLPSVVQQDEDEYGWITWAHSPPRPIPALHGPLSLPYARCPSGAEGTIVEGDDLNQKIWGLGSDDARAHSRSSHFPAKASAPSGLHANNLNSDEYQPMRRQDAVIDLSKPSTFHEHLDDHHDHRGRNVLAGAPSRSGLHSVDMRVQPPTMEDGNMDPMSRDFARSSGKMNVQPSMGLGLNWKTLLSSQHDYSSTMIQRDGSPNTHLNTAAPAFVPASQNVHSSQSRGAHIQQENETCPTNPSAARLSSNFVATPARPLASYDLPTPPSTASPRWSPVFQRQSAVQQTGNYDPRVYSPQVGLDDYSSQLLFLIQQMRGQDFLGEQDRLRSDPASKSPGETFLPQSLILKNTSRLQDLPPSSPGSDLGAFSPLVGPSPKDPRSVPSQALASPERRRNLTYQQPRSIPLARLIQRRLSSVAEEDLSRFSHSKVSNQMPLPALPPYEYKGDKVDVHSNASDTISINDAIDKNDSTVRVKLPIASSTSQTLPRDDGSGGSEDKENIEESDRVGAEGRKRKLKYRKRSVGGTQGA